MTELREAAILLMILLGGSAIGMTIRPFLSERHRSRETTDLIQLVMTMLVTFAALVLGLLTNSVKASFDGTENNLRSVSIQLIQLNRSLRQYGTEADPARALLRDYVTARIAATWPDEPRLGGDPDPADAPLTGSGATLDGSSFSDMLAKVETDIRGLDPTDPMHRRL